MVSNGGKGGAHMRCAANGAQGVKGHAGKGYSKNMPKPMTVSSRPCDVNYRLMRAHQHLLQAYEFLAAIDPETLPPEHHAALMQMVHTASVGVNDGKLATASPKRGRKEPAEVVEAPSAPEAEESVDPSEKYDAYDAG